MKSFLLGIALLFAGLANANEFGRGSECLDYSSDHLGRDVHFCVHRSRPELPSHGEPVVYFFHGMRGEAEEWNTRGYANKLEAAAKDSTFPAMTFVSFDTNGESFFSDYKNKPKGSHSYETWLLNEFMPLIEKEYDVCNKRECRGTMGFSMGGMGAIKTALRHPNLFKAAAGSCPALPPFNAYESTAKWSAYFSRHPIGAFKGMFLLNIVKDIFPSSDVFDEHDPSVIAENFPANETFPELYFDVGGKDTYGFQEGVERFKKVLDSKKFKYTSFYDPKEGHGIYKHTSGEVLRFISNSLR